jgi:hypothetical protein
LNNHGACDTPTDLGPCSSVAGGGFHTIAITAPPPLDTDGDGRPDSTDNCPTIANPTQADCNNDGIGDVCEIASGAPDFNQDTIPDTCQQVLVESLPCEVRLSASTVVGATSYRLVRHHVIEYCYDICGYRWKYRTDDLGNKVSPVFTLDSCDAFTGTFEIETVDASGAIISRSETPLVASYSKAGRPVAVSRVSTRDAFIGEELVLRLGRSLAIDEQIQWFRNGIAINPGSTDPLTWTVTANDHGAEFVPVIVNTCGETAAAGTTLSVSTAPNTELLSWKSAIEGTSVTNTYWLGNPCWGPNLAHYQTSSNGELGFPAAATFSLFADELRIATQVGGTRGGGVGSGSTTTVDITFEIHRLATVTFEGNNYIGGCLLFEWCSCATNACPTFIALSGPVTIQLPYCGGSWSKPNVYLPPGRYRLLLSGGTSGVCPAQGCSSCNCAPGNRVNFVAHFTDYLGCIGDINGDHSVDGADIGLLLYNWGPCGSACLADLNSDGSVNGGDIGLLMSSWGPCQN